MFKKPHMRVLDPPRIILDVITPASTVTIRVLLDVPITATTSGDIGILLVRPFTSSFSKFTLFVLMKALENFRCKYSVSTPVNGVFDKTFIFKIVGDSKYEVIVTLYPLRGPVIQNLMSSALMGSSITISSENSTVNTFSSEIDIISAVGFL